MVRILCERICGGSPSPLLEGVSWSHPKTGSSYEGGRLHPVAVDTHPAVCGGPSAGGDLGKMVKNELKMNLKLE